MLLNGDIPIPCEGDWTAMRRAFQALKSKDVTISGDATVSSSGVLTLTSDVLNAIKNLTAANNKMFYFTSAVSAAMISLSPYMRTVLDDTTAAAARGTLSAQTYDATLSAIAGLNPTASQMIYFTGTNAAATTAVTAYARTLLDDADAATARGTLGLGTMATQNANAVAITGGTITGITDLAVADGGTGASNAFDARHNLGLSIGYNVQAFDATLSAFAGLTNAANQFPYFTGTDIMDTATVTAYIRTLMDDADAATARATLGVSSATTAQEELGLAVAGIVSKSLADVVKVLRAAEYSEGKSPATQALDKQLIRTANAALSSYNTVTATHTTDLNKLWGESVQALNYLGARAPATSGSRLYGVRMGHISGAGYTTNALYRVLSAGTIALYSGGALPPIGIGMNSTYLYVDVGGRVRADDSTIEFDTDGKLRIKSGAALTLGNLDLNGSLNVFGAATLSSTLNVVGTTTLSAGLIVNESGADADSRMEGDTDANLFYLDAGNNRIGIGTNAPATKLDVKGTVSAKNVAATSTGSTPALTGTGELPLKLDRGTVSGGYIFMDLYANSALKWRWASNSTTGYTLRLKSASDLAMLDIGQTGEIVVNQDGANIDFRVEGDTQTHLLFLDAGNNRMGIGTSAPGYLLDVNGTFRAQGSTILSGAVDGKSSYLLSGTTFLSAGRNANLNNCHLSGALSLTTVSMPGTSAFAISIPITTSAGATRRWIPISVGGETYYVPAIRKQT